MKWYRTPFAQLVDHTQPLQAFQRRRVDSPTTDFRPGQCLAVDEQYGQARASRFNRCRSTRRAGADDDNVPQTPGRSQ